MLSEPIVAFEQELFYVAIRTKVNQKDISVVLPPLLPQLYNWIKQNTISCSGPPFFLYRSMDNNNELVAEAGVPVNKRVASDGHIFSDRLPAGRYAKIIYRGHYKDMMQGHLALESWIRTYGYALRERMASYGTVWGCRAEFYINDPQTEPDPSRWVTEIRMLLEEQ